jgi:predicted O-linked N-acetylglucosamine transferase (SPINDLY family)
MQNARAKKQHARDAEQILPRAIALHSAGSHPEAQALCEQILQHLPGHFDALHLLGVSKTDTGQFEEAAAILKRAVSIQPRSAAAHYHLGLAQFELKRYNAARASYEMAVALQPNFPLALNNLGNTLNVLGLREEAVERYGRAIAHKPDFADAFYNRGALLLILERFPEALASFDRCLAIHPTFDRALNGRGLVLIELRRIEEAVACFDRTLAVNPRFANAYASRGRALAILGRYDEAIESVQTALSIVPDLENAWMGLAEIYLLTGRLEEAFEAARRTLALAPDAPKVIAFMGQCFAQQGNIDEAILHFDRALEIKPDLESALMQKLFALDFASGIGFEQHQKARKAWWDNIGSKVAPQLPVRHANDRDAMRRIIVGYVSSDFRNHSAALCFMAVLGYHDRSAFEIVCYSCSPLRDEMTELFERNADKWVDASRLIDDELAERIKADKVDILVDLSGHTAGNRLAVFARKPAPVQVTAWGSASGTGLPTIDYLFSDPVATPQEVRHLYPERIHDLPCFMTMRPPAALLAPPPWVAAAPLTFGVFNRINKISDHALRLWCEILRVVPASRLVIKNPALDDVALARRTVERFTAHGIAAGRIDCVGSTSRLHHLAAYGGIDICLDPFPQNGGISTWEALHMGVPVVAKLGDSSAGRAAGAILASLGLSEWIAEDDASYIDIAVRFAAMPAYRKTLREELPARILTTAAGDPVAYTKSVELAYRTFWTRYCDSFGAGQLSA